MSRNLQWLLPGYLLWQPEAAIKKMNGMEAIISILDDAKRKVQIKQTVRGFLQLLDEKT